jgi:death-on-curing protein
MPVFLDTDEVLRVHAAEIEKFGGQLGVRSVELLESAVAIARASFGGKYLHNDIYEMASAYLFHITKNHPFIDGNKRTGAAAALVFLATNGILIRSEQKNFEQLVLDVATGVAGKSDIADFLRLAHQADGTNA